MSCAGKRCEPRTLCREEDVVVFVLAAPCHGQSPPSLSPAPAGAVMCFCALLSWFPCSHPVHSAPQTQQQLLAARGGSCKQHWGQVAAIEKLRHLPKRTWRKRQNTGIQSQNSSGCFKHSLDCSSSTTASYCTEQRVLRPFVAFSTRKL